MPSLRNAAVLAATALLTMTGAGAVVGQPVRLDPPSISASVVHANLVPESGFEVMGDHASPQGWIWDRRNTDATCSIDATIKRSGRQSLKLTNGTAFGAHIYGMLRTSTAIRLQPGKPYTLSVYVCSEDPGLAWVGGGSNWQYRLRLPATKARWQRAWMTFTPAEADRDFTLMACTDSPTKGLWIDDLKLEEGDSPTPDANLAEGVLLESLEPEKDLDGDGHFELSFDLMIPRQAANATLRATMDRPPVQVESKLAIKPGAWRVRVIGEAAAADDSPHTITLQLLDGAGEPVAARSLIRFFSATNATKRLDALAPKVAALVGSLEAVRNAGQDVAYPRATLTVLDNFVGYAREDLEHKEIRRALLQIGDLETMADRLERELSEANAGKRRFPEVPRWTGAKRPRIDGPSFIGPVTYASHPTSSVDRPIFFFGYGHFGQAQADIEKFPGYGVNIIQCEAGPSSVLPTEDQVSNEPMRHLRELLDRGRKSGVAVCLLISPHYFPDWAFAKYPHLRKKREGFLQYCLHAPEGQELLKRFIAQIIPPIKDHPALHSICLSNEPTNAEEPCEFARREFHAWLRERHGSLATLNARWGTQLASIDDAPLPDPFKANSVPPACWYDFVRFNQEWFAGWHRMLADAIHAVAPDLPVHAKGMTWTMTESSDVRFGVDAELFGGFSEINGNDSVCFYNHDPGEFAEQWQGNAAAYDLQRAVKNAPVFNTENHLIVDRETHIIPPEHVRAALWQQAIHGQSATTIWVWERTFDPRSDVAGSIMHRPACAEAVGRTALDLNRLADEVTAIQRLQPQVAILHSISGLVWDGGRYDDCAGKLYTALSFTGLKIGFVTERQLEQGRIPTVPMLFVPQLNHLSEAAVETLGKYTGQLMLVGDEFVLSRDEYNREQKTRLKARGVAFRYGQTGWPMLWQALIPILADAHLQPLIAVRDEHGQPMTGVAWLCARSQQGVVVNLCNYGRETIHLTLQQKGTPIGGQDLLNGEATKEVISMSPLQTRMIRVNAGG